MGTNRDGLERCSTQGICCLGSGSAISRDRCRYPGIEGRSCRSATANPGVASAIAKQRQGAGAGSNRWSFCAPAGFNPARRCCNIGLARSRWRCLLKKDKDRSNQNAGSSDERIRNLERQIKGIGPISFSGDVRLRAEPFFGGPSDESLDRVRARVRARFNAVATLGDQFRAGFTLASGDINDPTSTNQTLTGFYTRKAVALDLAFAEFKPKAFKPLTLVGGKFRYPWYNTELTWDKDLNPEGAAETLAFDLHTPVLKRFALVGFQLPFAEMAGTSSSDKRITQAITYGGQLQTTWQLAPKVTLSAYTGYYDYPGLRRRLRWPWHEPAAKNPQTPFSGALAVDFREPGAGLDLHHHGDHDHHRSAERPIQPGLHRLPMHSLPRSSDCLITSPGSTSIPGTTASR